MCDFCRQGKAKPSQPLMGQLPPDKVTPFVHPFAYTGVVIFSPFNVATCREAMGSNIFLHNSPSGTCRVR